MLLEKLIVGIMGVVSILEILHTMRAMALDVFTIDITIMRCLSIAKIIRIIGRWSMRTMIVMESKVVSTISIMKVIKIIGVMKIMTIVMIVRVMGTMRGPRTMGITVTLGVRMTMGILRVLDPMVTIITMINGHLAFRSYGWACSKAREYPAVFFNWLVDLVWILFFDSRIWESLSWLFC